MQKYQQGTQIIHKIGRYIVIVEKDTGKRVKGYAVYSNGEIDKLLCTFEKDNFEPIK